MKHIDPTEARIARDNEERRLEKAKRLDARKAGDVKKLFREAAGRVAKDGMKTTYAIHKASAKHPRKVL